MWLGCTHHKKVQNHNIIEVGTAGDNTAQCLLLAYLCSLPDKAMTAVAITLQFCWVVVFFFAITCDSRRMLRSKPGSES